MGKKTCVIYDSWGTMALNLPVEQAGILFQAICSYTFENMEMEIENPAVNAMFAMIKKKLDEDLQHYQEKVERMKTNRTDNRNHTEVTQKSDRSLTDISSDSVSDSVSVSVSEYVSDSDSDSDSVSDSEVHCTPSNDGVSADDVQRIADRWNELPDTVSRIMSIKRSGERWRLLRARIKENGVDGVLDAIDEVRQSGFLVGKNNRGWVITFDWFIKPWNFSKVAEGNYKDRWQNARSGTFDGNAYLQQLIEEAERDEGRGDQTNSSG